MKLALLPLPRILASAFLALVAGRAQTTMAESQVSFYISPDGSDAASGLDPSNAFRTLPRAQEAVRRVRSSAQGDVVVWMRGGRYELTAPLVFGPADGGNGSHYVRYVAYHDETPVISGGKRVTTWRPVAGGTYFEADVPTSVGYGDYYRQLYVNGRRAYRASGPLILGTKFHPAAGKPGEYDGVCFPKGVLKGYRNPTDLRLVHLSSFKYDEWPVVAVFDEGDSTVVQCQSTHFRARVARGKDYLTPGDQYRVVNAFEELDRPGEWYHDRVAGKVYYYPRRGEDLATAEVCVPVLSSDQLVTIEGASPTNAVTNLSFEGLTFEHSNWLFPRDSFVGGTQAEMLFGATGTPASPTTYSTEMAGGIRLNHTRGIRFLRNTVRHMAGCGIQLYNDASSTLIEGNIFHDTTGAAVEIGRTRGAYLTEDVPEQAPVVDNTVANNVIRDTGRDFMQATGISIFPALRTRIVHNDIADTAFMGIHSRMPVKGDWRTKSTDTSPAMGEGYIAFNRLGETNWASIYGIDDNASIYNFGPAKGTVIFQNYIQRSRADFGVYNDDNSFRMTWRQNVILARSNMSSRSVDEKTILYDGNFSSCPPPTVAASSGHCVLTDFTALPSDDPAGWPQPARMIAENAGLEPKYRRLLSQVPETPDYGYYLPVGERLATGTTKVAESGDWKNLELLWDNRVNTGEATNSKTEAWVEFDFGRSYDHLVLVVNRSHGVYGGTEWKVQVREAASGIWVDALPWVAATADKRQERTLPETRVAQRIRLLVRNDAKNGRVGLCEFDGLGQPVH